MRGMKVSVTKADVYNRAKGAMALQVATVAAGQPWVATVYFVVDAQLNFYWLSLPTARHSIELNVNSRVSIAIAIKPDLPVIGVQAEGIAAEVTDIVTIGRVMPSYIKKYGAGKQFLQFAKKGTAKHRLYKFTPKNLQLFDERTYPPNQNPICVQI